MQKKNAKGRLDKYYKLAKEQGYRARSAFKLIQLNKEYDFLSKAKTLVDLCAAPGGWLQVAQQYMPKPSIIIGLDLVAIKPIPGVITHVQDITSDKCKSVLRNELKSWTVDVFLHDGAPNVGTAWLQDAFTQSELVLASLKLATQFLSPNGSFVSKVFRSKDYNKLLWVFNQLFNRVEATKPPASRNVSAEIFVVCLGYKAPKKIDPRILDPKYVFKELDDVDTSQMDEKQLKERSSAILNDLMHPEKRKRHRDGYDEDNYTLFKKTDIHEFITSPEFIDIMARSNELSFSGEVNETYKNHSLTTPEIMECCKDLKVLGKKDFKDILKYRTNMRIALGLETKKSNEPQKEDGDVQVEELDLETQIEQDKKAVAATLKREKRKERERKAKALLKMRLGMETPMDIGEDASLNPLDFSDVGEDFSENEEGDEGSESSDSEAEEEYDSDMEKESKIANLERQMDDLYQSYREKQLQKDPVSLVSREKKKQKSQEFEEWYGIQYQGQQPDGDEEMAAAKDSSGSSSESEEEDDEPIELSEEAKTFFSNPVFQDSAVKAAEKKGKRGTKSSFDKELDISDEEAPVLSNGASSLSDEEDEDDIEVVKGHLVPEEDEDDSSYAIRTAEAYTLAQKLLTKSGKRDLIDDSFNRYSIGDTSGLPEWYIEDENRHNKKQLPVTKEAIQIMRQRMAALDARPIKKIAEAKFRQQNRRARKIQGLLKKADGIMDDDTMGDNDNSKLKDIAKLMKRTANKKKKKPELVVAKGARKGLKGRPKGVKGRYKMVDPRMKKELRADKRKKKARS